MSGLTSRLWFALSLILQGCGTLSWAQEHIEKPFEVGELGYIQHSEPCEWLTFDEVEWTTEASGRVYFATKPGRFKIAAMSPTKANKVLAFYTITVGPGPEPTPPNPDDKKPPKPPTPTPVAAWSEQIRVWTEVLPTAQKAQVPQVKAAFERAIQQIGTEAFTGPDIRTVTAKELATVPGFAGWASWDTQRTDADAAWARESYRDAAAYKQRWTEVVAGLALVKVAAAELPVVLQGRQITLQAQHHQIRGGRLYEYVCPQNGQRCRWQDMGEVINRGPGWVVVQ